MFQASSATNCTTPFQNMCFERRPRGRFGPRSCSRRFQAGADALADALAAGATRGGLSVHLQGGLFTPRSVCPVPTSPQQGPHGERRSFMVGRPGFRGCCVGDVLIDLFLTNAYEEPIEEHQCLLEMKDNTT